jgi:hypothetical protein
MILFDLYEGKAGEILQRKKAVAPPSLPSTRQRHPDVP